MEQVVKLNVVHASALGLGAGAIAALAVPAVLLRGLGAADAAPEVLGVIRLMGVVLLALAAVLWSARFWLLSPLGASTLRALAVIHGIGALMLLAQQVAAGRVLQSAVPILFVAALAFDYAASARRFSPAAWREQLGRTS